MTTSSTTTTGVEITADDVVATSKHWGILLTFGILTAGLGAAIIAWPDKTVAVVAVLLGFSLLISGIFSLVASFTQPDRTTGSRVLMAISGVLSVALGFLAFQGVTQAVTILVIIVGLGWLMRGILELVAGISAKGVPGRGLVIAGGVISIAAGGAILLWPSATLTVIAWIVGFTLVAIGIVQMIAAFQLRSIGAQVAQSITTGEVVTD